MTTSNSTSLLALARQARAVSRRSKGQPHHPYFRLLSAIVRRPIGDVIAEARSRSRVSGPTSSPGGASH